VKDYFASSEYCKFKTVAPALLRNMMYSPSASLRHVLFPLQNPRLMLLPITLTRSWRVVVLLSAFFSTFRPSSVEALSRKITSRSLNVWFDNVSKSLSRNLEPL